MTVFPWRRATEPVAPTGVTDADLLAEFAHVERFCPRCDAVTTWIDWQAPGSGLLACARIRVGETEPCGMTSGAELTDVECLNRDRWVARHEQAPRTYSWV